MPGRNFLFVPGPTNVPERILRAMNRAMEDHRSSAFPELATALFRDLRKVFKTTTGQAFIFPATGTGGWEAALVNTLSPGDRVLAPRYGQFSHLWIDLAQRHGLRVDIIDVEWGEGAPSDRIGEILAQDPQRDRRGAASRPAVRGRGQLHRLDRLPHGRVEGGPGHHWVAKGPDAARGAGTGLREPQGARRPRACQVPARLLRLRRHDQGKRHGILPVHALNPDAVRPA